MTNGCVIIIKNNVVYSLATSHTGMWITEVLAKFSADELLIASPLRLLDEILNEYIDPSIIPLVAPLANVPAYLKLEMRYAYVSNMLYELAEKLGYEHYNSFSPFTVIDQDTKDVTSDSGLLGRESRWSYDLVDTMAELDNLVFSRDGKRILKKQRVKM